MSFAFIEPVSKSLHGAPGIIPVLTKQRRRQFVRPSGCERQFGRDQLIVSKTDIKGRITYANSIFCAVSGYSESELLGAPHSFVRHPDMPRAVFKMLWDSLQKGQEFFGYVNNLAANGDNYWVFAHVTPSFDEGGTVIGYHSNRRSPDQRIIKEIIAPFYASLLAEEQRHGDRKAGLVASEFALKAAFQAKGTTYDAFIFSL